MRFNQHYLVCDGGAGWAWLKLFLPATSTRSAEGTVRFNGTRPVMKNLRSSWRMVINHQSLHRDSYTHYVWIPIYYMGWMYGFTHYIPLCFDHSIYICIYGYGSKSHNCHLPFFARLIPDHPKNDKSLPSLQYSKFDPYPYMIAYHEMNTKKTCREIVSSPCDPCACNLIGLQHAISRCSWPWTLAVTGMGGDLWIFAQQQ